MNTEGHQLFILLGSNILPEVNIPLAVQKLNQVLHPLAISSTWESPAVGSNGPNFLNAIGLYTTDLDQETLKKQILRPLEEQLGRVRQKDKYAPRTIDLDIIIWDGVVLDSNLWRYAYISLPFAEIVELLNPEMNAEEILEGLRGRQDLLQAKRREDVLRARIATEHLPQKGFGYLSSAISLSTKLMKSTTGIAPRFSPERIRKAT